VELHGITGECNGGLYAKAVRVGDLKAELSGVTLREERQTKQNDPEVKQLAQGFRSGEPS